MNKLIIAALVLVAFAAQASALRCYSCNYENDKKCKGEDAELGELAYTVDPDDDEFKYCVKYSYDSDKKGVRGTLDKDGLDSLDSAGVKNGKCKSGVDASSSGFDDDTTICVCDSDNCNGSGALSASVFTIAMVAILKFFH